LAWTLALLERLFRRIPSLDMHRQDMILARSARHWIAWRHTVLLHVDPMRLAPPTSIRERSILYLGRSGSWLNRRPVASSAASGIQFPALSQSRRTAEQKADVSGAIVRRNDAIEVLPTMAERQPRHRATGYASSPLLLVRANWSQGLTRSTAELTAADSIANRVVRQHRRMEERGLTRSLDSGEERPSSLLPAEPPLLIEKSRPPVRKEYDGKFVSSGERRNATTQPGTAMNVAHITDAVLKQLDRRLVAARERMGRI